MEDILEFLYDYLSPQDRYNVMVSSEIRKRMLDIAYTRRHNLCVKCRGIKHCADESTPITNTVCIRHWAEFVPEIYSGKKYYHFRLRNIINGAR